MSRVYEVVVYTFNNKIKYSSIANSHKDAIKKVLDEFPSDKIQKVTVHILGD